MKILCLIDGLCSGGAQRQLVGLAGLLKKNNHDVTFMWYHKDDFYRNQLIESGVSIVQLEAKNVILKILKLAKNITKLHPNVIIAYIDGPTMLVSSLKALKIIKARIIVSERNTTQYIDNHVRLKFFLYKYADIIVPNSYSQASFIRENFRNLDAKIHTITNFVDTDYFVPSKERTSDSICKIAVVGRINRQKNILNFLDAVFLLKQNINKFQVDWYGTSLFNEDYFQEIKEKSKSLGLEDIITFHEPKKDILSVYQTSDVFCLPSVYEGYPNVICEAMSCGLPIVCSRVCDNALIVEDNINGFLFDPNKIEDIKDKLLSFIQMTDENKKEFSKASRRMAVEKFSSESFINNYENIIHR